MAENQAEIVFLANYESVAGEKRDIDIPIAAHKIFEKMLETCVNLVTITRVVTAIENGKAIDLLKPEDFEAYLARQNILVNFKASHGFLSFKGYFAYCRNRLPQYQRAINFPIYPPHPETLQLNPIEPKATYALDNLLSYFKPASEQDRAILKSLFCTPAWSQGVGRRPIFVIMGADHLDSGIKIGKSTIAMFLGELYDGIIGPFKSTADDKEIGEKLAVFKGSGVILFDNIKKANWSSEVLEFLVTTKTLTARVNYVGPIKINNDFTVCVTLNNPSLSPDLASRAVVIRLNAPDASAMWEDEVRNYIEANRADIFADILHILAAKGTDAKPATRFPMWERTILNKVNTGSDVATYIQDSQAKIEHKVDVEDFELFIVEKLQRYFYRIGNEVYQVGVHVDPLNIEWVVSANELQNGAINVQVGPLPVSALTWRIDLGKYGTVYKTLYTNMGKRWFEVTN